MSESCPFCAPNEDHVQQLDDLTLTLRDAYPVSPGHTLVVTRRHVSSFFDATSAEQFALLAAIARAREQLDEEFHPAGYNIGVNVGSDAGQTVMHLHVHLIPRYQGDMPDPRGGIRHLLPGKGYYSVEKD